MPYKDPERKTEWDRSHRPEKLERLKEAERWAMGQIRALEVMRGGEFMPRNEYKDLRRALVSQFLQDRYGLGIDRKPAIPDRRMGRLKV